MSDNSDYEDYEIYFTAIKILGKEKYEAYLRAAEVKDFTFLELNIVTKIVLRWELSPKKS